MSVVSIVTIAFFAIWTIWVVGMIMLDPTDPAPPPDTAKSCEHNRQWWEHESPDDYRARVAHSQAEYQRGDIVPVPNPPVC